jgi:hypothetical protein
MSKRALVALLMFLSLGATALAPASAGAAPAERRQQSITKINYPGYGIQVTRLSGDQRKLEGTPGSLKRFVKARLDVLFEEAGSKPRCAESPTLVVDRYDSRGWAKVGEGWYGACPAGGYAAIYDQTSSGWRQILGAQDVRYCQDLAWYGVPNFIAGGKCLTEEPAVVNYGTNKVTTTSPEATARRALAVASDFTIVPVKHVAVPEAVKQIQVLIDQGASLTVGECMEAGDGNPLGVHLADASFGCAVSATYAKGRHEDASIMFRMTADGDDIVLTELYQYA